MRFTTTGAVAKALFKVSEKVAEKSAAHSASDDAFDFSSFKLGAEKSSMVVSGLKHLLDIPKELAWHGGQCEPVETPPACETPSTANDTQANSQTTAPNCDHESGLPIACLPECVSELGEGIKDLFRDYCEAPRNFDLRGGLHDLFGNLHDCLAVWREEWHSNTPCTTEANQA